MQRILLYGDPVAHSLSPSFQQAALDQLAIPARYLARRVESAQLSAELAELRADPAILGANVTVPHKQAVVPLVDDLDAAAQAIGAVNTICRRNGRLVGFNTDAHGFGVALAEEGFAPAGRTILVIGAGGAARAVVYALRSEADTVLVAARDIDRARGLCHSLGVQQTAALSLAGAEDAAARADLIVNATPVGLDGTGMPIPAGWLHPGQLVFDLLYTPSPTPLLSAAAARGARTVNGLRMLLQQGAMAFTLWSGRPAPIEVMWSALQRAQGLEVAHR